MYTLYYSADACSLATQVILHELDQKVEIIEAQGVENFQQINPVGAVPVLIHHDENSVDTVLTEGAAIILFLLNKYDNNLIAAAGTERQQGIENILFANATMHPAYGRLFFIAQHIQHEESKLSAFASAAESINALWRVVENKLAAQAGDLPYLGGETPSAADILLSVYSRWGNAFPVTINLGEKTQKMLDGVLALPSFQRALIAEQKEREA